MKKRIIKTLCIVITAIILAVMSYLIYIVLSYHRVADNLTLEIKGNATSNAPVTLIAADKMKIEGDTVSGMTDDVSPSSYAGVEL